MNRFSILFCVAAVTVFATAAFGDDDTDPALFQDGSVCGPFWCTSASTGIDPNTNDSTLEFVLNVGSAGPPVVSGITTPFVTGWVQFFDTTTNTVLDYLDFTIVGGKDTIFLYCNNAFCGTNDAGLPSITPVNPVVVTATNPVHGGAGPNYNPPTPSSPGYGTGYDNTKTKSSFTPPTYTVIYSGNTPANGHIDVPVPEPSALMLLSSMMIGLAAFARKKFSASV